MAAVTRPLTGARRVDEWASTTGAASAGLVAPIMFMGIVAVLGVAMWDGTRDVSSGAAVRRHGPGQGGARP